MKVILLVWVWNEEVSLKIVCKDIRDALKKLSYPVDVVFVDNNSTDSTQSILKNFKFSFIVQKIPGIRYAYVEGISWAIEHDYDVIVIAQSDGNCDFRFLQQLIDPVRGGSSDMVVASRYLRTKKSADDTAISAFGNQFFSRIYGWISKSKVSDALVGFRSVRLSKLIELDLLNPNLRYWKIEKFLGTSLGWSPLITLLAFSRKWRVDWISAPEPPRIGGKLKKKSFRWGLGFLYWGVIVFLENRKFV